MENGLLYLCSTIAQCLAAAIALLVAFALYRLQSIDNAMFALCNLLKEPFGGAGGMHTALSQLDGLQAEGKYGEFIEAHARWVAV